MIIHVEANQSNVITCNAENTRAEQASDEDALHPLELFAEEEQEQHARNDEQPEQGQCHPQRDNDAALVEGNQQQDKEDPGDDAERFPLSPPQPRMCSASSPV